MLSLTLIAVLATCPASPTNSGLVGLWETRQTSKGGIGHTMEFRQDGTAVLATTVIVNMFYRVSENRLTVSNTADGAGGDTTTFRIDRGQLFMAGSGGAEMSKTRMNGAKGASIVGDWTFQHYTGSAAYERYTDDGRVLFRLPMNGRVSCFADGQGVLSFADSRLSALPFTLSGDELRIEREGKPPLTYQRVPGGPWYPREPAPAPTPAPRR